MANPQVRPFESDLDSQDLPGGDGERNLKYDLSSGSSAGGLRQARADKSDSSSKNVNESSMGDEG